MVLSASGAGQVLVFRDLRERINRWRCQARWRWTKREFRGVAQVETPIFPLFPVGELPLRLMWPACLVRKIRPAARIAIAPQIKIMDWERDSRFMWTNSTESQKRCRLAPSYLTAGRGSCSGISGVDAALPCHFGRYVLQVSCGSLSYGGKSDMMLRECLANDLRCRSGQAQRCRWGRIASRPSGGMSATSPVQ